MSRKGIAQILYFPFVLVMVAVVVIVFAYMPTKVLDESIKVSSLDATLARRAVENRISYTDPFTLRDYSMTLKNKEDFKSNFDDYFTLVGKNAAYMLSFERKDVYYNENLYLTAKDIAPLGDYVKVTFKKDVTCLEGSKCGQVIFEQILPKVYDVK